MHGKKPELILPAGSMDALKAAVLNGADAVYCGVNRFNARARAENFSMQQLADAVDFCHLHGKKIYFTLNILIKDSELDEAIETAKQAYCLGVDAIIVQDLGLIRALSRLLPEAKLHASTQMTCHNKEGALLLDRLGISRIVLARELSLQEIKAIKSACRAEIECFVHGALCFSYSGQCLFSSFLFNKSGNRGRCLQPCRLCYSLQGKDGSGKKSGYVLSMKDLMPIKNMDGLIGAGIDSFKVEGRLKGVEYVASVARAYRAAIDHYFGAGDGPSEKDLKLMQIAFLRESTGGYFFGGGEMVSSESSARKGIVAATVLGFKGKMPVLELHENLFAWERLSAVKGDVVEEFSAAKIFSREKEVPMAFKGQTVLIETGKKPFLEKGQRLFFTSSRYLKDIAYASLKKSKKIPYKMHVLARAGKRLQAKAEFFGKSISIESEFVPAKSKTKPATEQMLKEKLFKASDFFEPMQFSCEILDDPFLPLSELKKFKNQATREMRGAFFSRHRKSVGEAAFNAKKKELFSFGRKAGDNAKGNGIKQNNCNAAAGLKEKQPIALFIESEGQIPSESECIGEIACYDSMGKTEIEKISKRFPEKQLIVKSSAIQSDSELLEFEKNFVSSNAKIACSNLGALNVAIRKKAVFWAGRELNAFNSLAVQLLLELGAEKIVPSVECSLRQLKESAFREKLAPLAFFYPALMTSKAYKGTSLRGEFTLTDRIGARYCMRIGKNGLARIFNQVPVDMIFELQNFLGFGAICIDLAATGKEEAAEAMRHLSHKLQAKPFRKTSKFTRGHYEREVE